MALLANEYFKLFTLCAMGLPSYLYYWRQRNINKRCKFPGSPSLTRPQASLLIKRVTLITLPLPRENKIGTLHIPNNMQKSAFRPNLHQAPEIPRRKMATLLCITRNHSFNTLVQIQRSAIFTKILNAPKFSIFKKIDPK